MGILGTGSNHYAGRYAKKPVVGRGATAAHTVCQKCLQVGHWTYECKNAAAYQARPTRTKQLTDPKYKPRFLGAGELLPESREAQTAEQKEGKKKKKKQEATPSSSSDDDDDSSSPSSGSGDDSSDSSDSSGSSGSSSSDSSSASGSSSASDDSSSGSSGSDSSDSSGSSSDDESGSSDSASPPPPKLQQRKRERQREDARPGRSGAGDKPTVEQDGGQPERLEGSSHGRSEEGGKARNGTTGSKQVRPPHGSANGSAAAEEAAAVAEPAPKRKKLRSVVVAAGD